MHIKTVSKYIRRSPYQAVSAALIMTLTFFTISVFAVLTFLSIRLINHVETRPQLTVFFKDNIENESQITDLKNQLIQTGKVSKIKFVTKQEALSIYKQLNREDTSLTDFVSSDILPSSIDIQATNAQDLASFLPIVTKYQFTDKVAFQKDIVDVLISWVSILKQIGAVIVGVLIMVSIFVILTIIGIKITIRRDEIETMRLIGASSWFIRIPFILEGMLYGFVGSVLGWMATYALLLYTQPTLASFFKGVPILPLNPIIMLELLFLEVLIASFLGAFASFLAVLRYLK